MENINYAALLPDRPREDVVSFARQSGAFGKSYLVYRADRVFDPLEDRNKEMVRVACSACEEAFYAEKIQAGCCSHNFSTAPFGWKDPVTDQAVISGDETACPWCGELAKVIHVGNMRLYGGEHVDDACMSVLSRLPVEGRKDRLVLTNWCVRRCVDKQARTRYEVWPYTAWVVEEKKIVRLMGYRTTMSGAISLFGTWEQRKTFRDVYGETQFLMPWDPALLEGTTAENSKLDLYMAAGGKHPVGYLALWRKRPAVENLLVQGWGKLVADWLREETERSLYRGGIPRLTDVNWKENRPAQMLRLSKEEFRRFRRDGADPETIRKISRVRESGIEVKIPQDLELLERFGVYALNEILYSNPGADFWRILRYLRDPKRTWYMLRDYWRMAENLGRDMTDSLVRWPRDLDAAHDRAQREQKLRKKELLAAGFAKRAEALAGLSFARDGLLIRPCADEEELIFEGKVLHHCVASYARDHASGKTAILFIRRETEPDKPFFTLEFDEKNMVVRQNRGLRNCNRTPEVQDFENAWLEWVKAGMKKKARVKAA